MRIFPTLILIVFATVTSIIGSQCIWLIPDEITATNAWMLCDAISKVLFVGAFWNESKGVLKIVLFTVFLLAINNVLDELFFDRLKLGWNEIALLIAIITHAFIVYARTIK